MEREQGQGVAQAQATEPVKEKRFAKCGWSIGFIGALVVCVVLAVAFSLGGSAVKTGNLPAGASANDVTTLTPVDQDKTVITVRTEYNIDDTHMEQALEQRFPDIDFVFQLHASVDASYELRESVSNDEEEDIVLARNANAIQDIAPDHFLDLSADSFTNNYSGSALRQCEINGKIYYLPGPSNVFGIVYDKTMFQEHGWTVPASYDEFIDLCAKINATGIRAIQPTCQYARQAQTVFTAFCYNQLFAGADNYRWLTSYQQGQSTMAEHMTPAFARYDQLHAAGVIQASDFDLSPAARSTAMYTDHSCAMIIENQLAQNYASQFKSDHEYAMMPFWCGNDADSDVLITVPNYYVAANAALDNDAAKKRKVLAVLDYISTPEGQLAIAGGSLSTSSNVKGTPTQTNSFNEGIQATITKGNCVSEVQLLTSGDNNPAEKALRTNLQKYLAGTSTAEQVTSAVDTARNKALATGIDRGAVVGIATDDFTPMQTGVLIADALKEKAGADVGLAIVGQTDYGTNGRLYKGDVTEKDIAQITLSINQSSTNAVDDRKLWVLSMTGAQLESLLETPITAKSSGSVFDHPYFVASGLNITFAPWAAASERVESVTLADGTQLDPDKTYRVAMWCWPFAGTCPYPVETVYQDTDTSLFAAYIAQRGTITPSNGGMRLDWGKRAS